MSPVTAAQPAVAERRRTLIGKVPSLGDREYVYRCDDALEIDAVDGYEVETKRVFFSDVEMITWHQRYSTAGLWIGGISVALGGFIWLLVAAGTRDPTAGWVTFWLAFVPNLPILLWYLWPYKHVTVFGRRSVARMRWHFRRERSRQVFEQLTQDVRSWQEAHREAEPVMAPPPTLVAPPAAALDSPAGPALS